MFAEIYAMKLNHSPKPLNHFKTMKKLALIAAGLMLSIGAAFAQDAEAEKKKEDTQQGDCHECGDTKIVPIKVQVDCVLKLDVEEGLNKFHFKAQQIEGGLALEQTLGLSVTGNVMNWALDARLADDKFEEISSTKEFDAIGKVAVEAGMGYKVLNLANQQIRGGSTGSESFDATVKIGPIGLTEAEPGTYLNAIIFDLSAL